MDLDMLDVSSETHNLSPGDFSRMGDIKKELDEIWKKEESALWQRSRDRKIKEGVRNTAYFHVVANQRRRKNHLSILEGPDGPVYSTKDMMEVATNFYKNLFGFEPKPNIHLDDQFWSDEEMVTEAENTSLERPFSEEEIKEAIMGSYANGAPGPDGLSFLFYQQFWEVIKGDFMALVKDFENGVLDVQRLNYSIVTLIPKEPDAKNMRKFRPICLRQTELALLVIGSYPHANLPL